MTLDEAIKHCKEVAMDNINHANLLWNTKEKARCEECAEEHRQLAEWLKELKEYREIKEKMENGAKKLHFVNNKTIMDLREVTTDETNN